MQKGLQETKELHYFKIEMHHTPECKEPIKCSLECLSPTLVAGSFSIVTNCYGQKNVFALHLYAHCSFFQIPLVPKNRSSFIHFEQDGVCASWRYVTSTFSKSLLPTWLSEYLVISDWRVIPMCQMPPCDDPCGFPLPTVGLGSNAQSTILKICAISSSNKSFF